MQRSIGQITSHMDTAKLCRCQKMNKQDEFMDYR